MTKKIKLNKSHREVVEEYGLKHIAATIDRAKEQKQLALLLDGTNAAIRLKYPEVDMLVLRKYKLERIDRCIKYQFPSGRVDGFTFVGDVKLAAIPYKAGCHYSSNDVFPVTAATEKAFDEFARLKAENDKKQNAKIQEFRAFLVACQFVDEVLDVLSLPEQIRTRLGHNSNALVAVTAETVKSLQAMFKAA